MRQKILDESLRLIQTRGYDGFSYADVSDAVGIRKASIHHHFPTKGDLAAALVEVFRETCRAAMAEIDRKGLPPGRRLTEYARIFQRELEDGGRMCLCGILAAGQATLPDEPRAALAEAVAEHEAWLTATVKAGQQAGELRGDVPAARIAQTLFATLEGAMLFARVRGGAPWFRNIARTAIAAQLSGVAAD